ncbi:MAG: proprotein convertase P-domain-containing protein [Bacteroidota bacterium]
MKKIFLCLFAFLLANTTLLAQSDPRIAKNSRPYTEVELYGLPKLNNKALMEAELEQRKPGRAPKFATSITADISPSTHGSWEKLPNGNDLWRIRIKSPGAKSLNLGFTTYVMPKGGSMILYSPDKQYIQGPFTPGDNETHAQLWTPVVQGDELIVEVQLPARQKSQLQLKLSYINHDYMGFSNLLSGSCNIDVLCGSAQGLPLIDEYRDIIQSVGVYGFNGNTFCTGFLVNNTAQDCKPYFMTADHCGVSSGNAPTMVIYWNFQNSTCRTPGSSPSGGNGDGQLNLSNSGAIYRAGWSGSDFALVELDDPVNPAANPYFAGWDRSANFTPDSVVCVHHPNTDEKRISFEYDNTFLGNQGNGAANPNSNYIVVSDWDDGTTEGGSSGAPLFDKEGRVIGQLFGGLAACGNNSYDAFGWINKSWTGAGSSSSRLSDWLDPMGSGVQTLEGRNCANSVIVSPTLLSACSVSDNGSSVNFNLEAGQGFSANVNLSVNNLPSGFSASFGANPVAPGSSTTLTVQIPAGYNGNVNFEVVGDDGVESSNSPLILEVTNLSPISTTQTSPADRSLSFSTVGMLEWQTQATMLYDLQVASDANFNSIALNETELSDSEFQLEGGDLEEETTYYWRVRSTNACGVSAWSSVFSFTTGALFCEGNTVDNLNIGISSGGPNTVSSSQIINQTGVVNGVKLSNINITHTWVGDLTLTLESPAGTRVTLYSEPFCDEGNLLLSFDDQASTPYSVLEGTCRTSPPAISGTFQPLESLSAFIGEPMNGPWILEVADGANGDGGSLNAWTLEFCSVTETSFGGDIEEIDICTGDTVNIDLILGNAFQSGTVNFAANNLPLGAQASFTPQVGTANSTATAQLTGFGGAGNYNIELTASNTSASRSFNVLVRVDASPNVNLISPVNMAGGLTINPAFSWNLDPNAASYRIEVATDDGFSNIVASQTTTDDNWTSPDLDYGSTYYWRVIALGNCGETVGETRSFGTDFRTGLEEELGGSIKLFPNPSQGQIHIELPTPSMEDMEISLYSMDGKKVFSGSWVRGKSNQDLNLSEIGSGIYVLSVGYGDVRWNKKVIITP